MPQQPSFAPAQDGPPALPRTRFVDHAHGSLMDEPVLARVCPNPPPDAPAPGQALLDKLLTLNLLEPAALESFLSANGHLLIGSTEEALGEALVEAKLLTTYQLDRVRAGTTHGLVLGSYRVLDKLGAGGMGVVFVCEHHLLKRRAAVKVLPVDDDCPPALRQRFYAEMRVLAEMHHPNVVMAFDAGEVGPDNGGANLPPLMYLVMELVDGGDLEGYVVDHGPCAVVEACNYIRQAACGLQATHDRHLVHRDLKPSNLLRTARGEVKLVDFGLARQFCSRLTDQRALLGSLEFMPPEQSHDPSAVGKEADIYGLGATLFWLLTGEPPYPFARTIGQALRCLQRDPPRRLRDLRPEVPDELDDLVARMLDRNPVKRPTSALAIMNALLPFLLDEQPMVMRSPDPAPAPVRTGLPRRVLIVDDEAGVRMLHRMILKPMGYECVEVETAAAALAAARAQPFDLIVLDLNLPDGNGYDVCRALREPGDNPYLKIIIVSGAGDQNELAEALPRGADDYIPKPFEPRQMMAKVQHAFRLKEAQERAQLLAEQLALTNQQLERSLDARARDVRQAHDALVFTMARMAESRDGETPGHLRRLQAYTKVLARQAAGEESWAGLVDERFLEQLERCVPLHDLGKLGLPDEVLLKPGALSPAERALVETHTLIGDRILEALGREHGTALEFLGPARVVVRSHHERWDGRGYPDRLAGDAIPPAARLVAVADVYDALRRERSHKAALPHAEAVRIILEQSAGQFDPALLRAFALCQQEFARIYRDITP